MGFFSRMFIPRGVRRAMHPARTLKRAITPKPIKRARRALHPFSNATYAFERQLTTKRGRVTRAPVFHHGSCTMRHRSAAAAAKCRRTY
jgi:hypothetical protein